MTSGGAPASASAAAAAATAAPRDEKKNKKKNLAKRRKESRNKYEYTQTHVIGLANEQLSMTTTTMPTTAAKLAETTTRN